MPAPTDNHRAAMQSRFPHFEDLFYYRDDGAILKVDAGFTWKGSESLHLPEKELREFICKIAINERHHIERFCDFYRFVKAIDTATPMLGVGGGPLKRNV